MCQILKMSSIMSQSKLPTSNFISTYTHSPTFSKGLLEGEGAGVRYVPLAHSVALASGFGRRVGRTGRGCRKILTGRQHHRRVVFVLWVLIIDSFSGRTLCRFFGNKDILQKYPLYLWEPLTSSILDATTCPFIVPLVHVDSIGWVPLLCRRWPLLGRSWEDGARHVLRVCFTSGPWERLTSSLLQTWELQAYPSATVTSSGLSISIPPAYFLSFFLGRSHQLCLPCRRSLLLSC